jgi:YHS domain-containing protein
MQTRKKENMRVGNLVLTIALLAATVAAAFAASARFGKVDPINKTFTGVAIKGYDAVAYFTEGRPVKGRSEFQYEWLGAKWHFASAANRDAFAKNSIKYAPQFGGYCAWAVSQGYTAGIDPEAWKMVDGKLYLNYSKSVQKMWEQDVPGNIRKGHENWPKLH